MKVDHIQTSFVGGEFGNSLVGRTDVAQYANACEIVENMLIRPFGSVISTPGTRYVNECKNSTNTSSTTRLLKFIFNRADAYIIEFGHKYFRFYTDQAVVVTTGTTPFELAHTYTADQLFDVHFAQKNDVIWLTHPDHPPRKLTRLSANNWTIADFTFLGGPFLDDNTGATKLSVSATSGSITVTSSTAIFSADHVNAYFKIGGTAVTSATTGLGVQGYIKITAVTSSTIVTATVMACLDTSVATTEWAEGAWSVTRGYPAFVVFHEGRLFFARTDYEPQGVWGSKSFEYDNFALDNQEDDDAIDIELSSNESNEIKWMASGDSLIVGTYGAEFVINSGVGDPITPSNISARRQSTIGSEEIDPQKIGNFLYFVQRIGRRLRELFYFYDTNIYKAVDKTILSPQILGDGIVDMAYQQSPDTILWCVRSDGVIATLTREVDQEVQGWSRQITDGEFKAIAVIPSQSYDYDEVWVVVDRVVNGAVHKYIEVFENPEVPDRQDLCLYLHSALTYNAYDETASPIATNLSLSVTSGTSVVVTTSAAYFSTDDVGQRIRTIDADGVTLGELEITAYTSTTVVIGKIVYAFDALSYTAGYWGVSVDTISGLDHLEAENVKVLADGGLDEPAKTVSAGIINLEYNYFVVSAGLPYEQKLRTLPPEAGSARGTSQGKIQKIYQLSFKVNRSFSGFQVGGNDDLLDQINFRDPSTLMGTPEALYTGTIPNILFRDDFRYGSQVTIFNDEPLPMEILSIIYHMETYDK
jgi:hypothetical protein